MDLLRILGNIQSSLAGSLLLYGILPYPKITLAPPSKALVLTRSFFSTAHLEHYVVVLSSCLLVVLAFRGFLYQS